MIPMSKKQVILMSLCFLAGVVVGLYILNANQLKTKRQVTWKSIFDEPLNPDRTDCLNLFDKPKLDKDFYSPNYLEHRLRFDAKFKHIIDAEKEKGNKPSDIEGNSGKYWYQSRLYHWLAGQPWVNTVCETGFNAGHSTLQWLTGSDNTKVYSFDIDSHYYTRPMADYVNRTFPGRFHLTFGDSLETVPRFASIHPEVICDVILVDGGHSHSVAIGDLRNLRKLVNVERNVLVPDDINYQAVSTAWIETQADGLAVQRFACTDKSGNNRSYVVGYYV